MASRYWVGGGSSTNWNATGNTNWASSSGGANNASVPGSTDDVFFDANSGTGDSVLSAAITIQSIDFTGYAGTFTHNAFALNIGGAGAVAKWVSGMTYTPANSQSAAVNFTNTSGTISFTTAGKSFSAIGRNGVGGTVQLQDALLVTNGTFPIINFTSGTFDANGFAVSTSSFNGSNSNTRSLLMGGGTWTFVPGGGTIWTTATQTGLTFDNEGSPIVVQPTPNDNNTIFNAGAGLTFAHMTLGSANNTTNYFFFFQGASTYTTLVVHPYINLGFNSSPITVTNPFDIIGDPTHPCLIRSGSLASVRGFSVPSGTCNFEYCAFQNFSGAGGATFLAKNSMDLLGNTGITITPPSAVKRHPGMGGGLVQ